MTRRLLNLLTLLSLLLCVAVVALWVRSYYACDRLAWIGDTAGVEVIASRGRAELSRITVSRPLGVGGSRGFTHYTSEPREIVPGVWDDLADGSIPGIRYARESDAGGTGVTLQVITLPHYLLAALTLALPAGRAVSDIRSRRLRTGRCACGYDLRATPDRCPECGTIAAAPPPA